MTPLIAITDLAIDYPNGIESVRALDGTSLAIGEGEAVALVGESGSGKSTLALALAGGLPASARRAGGDATWRGRSLFSMSADDRRAFRRAELGFVAQDPHGALDPTMRVGRQLLHVLERAPDRKNADVLFEQHFARVGLRDPQRIARSYPHELSGGMAQRVGIALALANRPALLIADEPTAALDATLRQQILTLIRQLCRETGASLLLITHDLEAAETYVERIAVMLRGRVVEDGAAARVFHRPTHDYTRSLLASRSGEAMPAAVRADGAKGGVRYDSISVVFSGSGRETIALDDVTFEIAPGEMVGLVGESGSGKTTLGLLSVGLRRTTKGRVAVEGRSPLEPAARRGGGIQLVGQNPRANFNPLLTIGASVSEPLRLAHADHALVARRLGELLEAVGLPAHFARRYPHQLSGGQLQRAAIARALSSEPRFIVYDEAVSALDASIQTLVLQLVRDTQHRLSYSGLFISHDLDAVRRVSHRIAVLYRGMLFHVVSAAALGARIAHPYTLALRDASREGGLKLRDDVAADSGPAGCPLHARCPLASDRCRTQRPELRSLSGQLTACHNAEQLPHE